MKYIVLIISKFVSFLGKLMKRGSSLPGMIALILDKNILKKMTLPENIILVTGSNGKTTTTEMIANALTHCGIKAEYNHLGSNQLAGVATMIINASTVSGHVKADALVIESDERSTKQIVKYIKPKYMVVTNIYRDQMTRNGHPDIIYDEIKKSINNDVHLILNTDDPLSSLYGYNRKNVTYIGIEKNYLSTKENNSRYSECKYCPNCKEELKYKYYHFNHIGSYKCPKCGHSRKKPDYYISDIDLKKGFVKINDKYKVNMSIKSFYNAYNTLFAYAILKLENIPDKEIIDALDKYIIKNDRVQNFKFGKSNTTLLTSKHENSISYNQSIRYVISERKPCTVVIIVDAISRKYYTSETSWLWDIDFELLNNKCVKNIVLAGKYSHDLMVRFKFSGIDEKKIMSFNNLDEMASVLKSKDYKQIYVITCFADRMKFINRR